MAIKLSSRLARKNPLSFLPVSNFSRYSCTIESSTIFCHCQGNRIFVSRFHCSWIIRIAKKLFVTLSLNMTLLKPSLLKMSSLKRKVALTLLTPLLFVLRLALKAPVNVSESSTKFKSSKAPTVCMIFENRFSSLLGIIGTIIFPS